jgi:glycosyltransferase involved in cell wall biosynthesis
MLSNRRHRAAGAGPENEHNRELLADRGWDVKRIHVQTDSIADLIIGTVRALSVAIRSDIAVVDSHCSPPELHIVGLIVSTLAAKPWLAEFRDPLVTNVHVDPGSLSSYLRQLLERVIVTAADHVVWWNGIQMDENYFEQTYPGLPDTTWQKIPELGFGGLNAAAFESADPQTFNEFTLVYAGSFYEGWIEPYGFFEGLARYRKNSGSPLKVQFYGDWRQPYQSAAEDLGIAEWIEPMDAIPHNELISVLKGADALLYVGGTDPQNRQNIPLKLCDYVGARTPILGIVDPEFRAATLVSNHNLGIVASPRDPDDIANAIKQLQLGEISFNPDEQVFEWFSSDKAMDRYAALLSAVADGIPPTERLGDLPDVNPL